MGPRGVPHGPQGAVSQRALRGDTMGPFTVLQLCKAQPSIKKTMQNCKWSYGARPRVLCGTPQGPMHRPLRSEMRPPRGPGGANETKSFKFRWFLGPNDKNALYIYIPHDYPKYEAYLIFVTNPTNMFV